MGPSSKKCLLSLMATLLVAGMATCSRPLETKTVGNHPSARAFQSDELYNRMAGFVLPVGYPLEQYFVTTPDGYILRLFRIPHGKSQQQHDKVEPGLRHDAISAAQHNEPAAEGDSAHLLAEPAEAWRPVVYMQHALLDSTVDWVFLGPGKGLAFLLADAGYDVWMGNIRGNTFSRNHTSLDPNHDEAFWAFSFDEHALVDLPAMVDEMTQHTGVDKFAYVGYSQGTMMAFCAFSSLPDLASRVTVAVLMAPLAFITHSTALGVQIAAHADTDKIYQLLGIGEWLGHEGLMPLLLSSICRLEPTPCVLAMGAIGGFNPSNIDPKILPFLFQYMPAGTSVQNAAHWSQAIRSNNESCLQKYDFGTECENPLTAAPQPCNQKAYGQSVPPAYNLSGITTPLALFTGGQDMLADPRDTRLLLQALSSSTVIFVHEEPSYSHWDFGFGNDVHEKVFPSVIALIQKKTVHNNLEK